MVLIFLTIIIFGFSFSNVFAEVMELHLDRDTYFMNDSIFIDGFVADESSGFVTIVLRDPDGKFLLLSQAIIQPDNKFQKEIPIDSKFQISGTYNATAFVLNMTNGKFQNFDVLGIDSKKIPEKIASINEKTIDEPKDLLDNMNKIILESKSQDSKFEFNELTYEKTNPFSEQVSKIADFVDPTKNPQVYLDRYYNEPKYKSWFDRNYPDLTIEEAVGYRITTKTNAPQMPQDNQIIPRAEASSFVPLESENNEDIGLTVLTIFGLGFLFAAVYGIKIKSDNKSKLISLNKETIKKRIFLTLPKRDATKIIKTRLAKGEITIEDYNKLKRDLIEEE